MIRLVSLVLTLACVTGALAYGAQTAPAAAGQVLGTVRVTQAVLADGKPLAPGTYDVRLTSESLTPLAGQTPGAERRVEFVANGQVIGRDVAVVMSASGAADTAQPRVELLKGGEFLRISATRGGERYLIHLPLRP
jgi:hypothetical protein